MREVPVVREARPDETPVVARLVAKLLSELDGASVDPISVALSAEAVLGLPAVTAFLAVAGDEAVGVLVLNECAAIYAGGLFGEISELYVDPDWRSTGVASLLVQAARTLGQERGWKRLEVGAPPQPDWARTLGFYQREGFEEVGPRLRRIL
ncbi:GNAT family N-acetyltransferase [Tropicibacter sp. Alg240-R139]|uniref:GNAT family N-acetyltransferase n=1 Tax=Tropicibacter sp. Alg240-R139 TaxID=2305991 RepID=UPI0013E04B24|nr:GNAT family N-acetyltransferase [Tropicibacter sp. Alg240-R139]